jgi:hypothetical protein
VQPAKNLLPARSTEASTVTLIGWYRVTGKAVQRVGTVGRTVRPVMPRLVRLGHVGDHPAAPGLQNVDRPCSTHNPTGGVGEIGELTPGLDVETAS